MEGTPGTSRIRYLLYHIFPLAIPSRIRYNTHTNWIIPSCGWHRGRKDHEDLAL